MTTRCATCNTLVAVTRVIEVKPMRQAAKHCAPGVDPYEVQAQLACRHATKFVTTGRQLTAWRQAHPILAPA